MSERCLLSHTLILRQVRVVSQQYFFCSPSPETLLRAPVQDRSAETCPRDATCFDCASGTRRLPATFLRLTQELLVAPAKDRSDQIVELCQAGVFDLLRFCIVCVFMLHRQAFPACMGELPPASMLHHVRLGSARMSLSSLSLPERRAASSSVHHMHLLAAQPGCPSLSLS